eukprot:gnl/TRDRNA2_/TRDRNA2_29896_c0_seq2.p1 gnl/TRDRNA2_/TRDRNA2_29896_c0~~gnl/TRDRNA2_/TRDRNA2_29896_c0_seq2.p1  ORF type:complete len:313 (-),score=62.99 gnl/TRDRNA2_/TRDRNA2_29896_c0_seq2:35-973(-)
MANHPLLDQLGAAPIESGSTVGFVSLGRTKGGVFVFSFDAGKENPENRWTLAFTRAVQKAFDAVEDALEKDPPKTPAALLTVSASDKFFSNGIDLAGMAKATAEEGAESGDLMMSAFVRPILLPIPTLCAIGGHAFGAGMMHALCHDVRLQRVDKGYTCAIEVAIGIKTPPPEFTIFRHDLSATAFHQSVLLGKRWAGEEAAAAGVVHKAVPGKELLSAALKEATMHAALGANREVMRYYKRQLKGYVAKEVFEYSFPAGKTQLSREKLPARLVKYIDDIVVNKKLELTWGVDSAKMVNAPRVPLMSAGSKL